MSVHISHLISVTFCDTDDQVVDDGLDCAEGSDILADAVVEFDIDGGLGRTGEAD